MRPSLDYVLAKSNVAAAEAVLQQRRQILEQVRRQLELLLGRYPAAEISIAKSLPEPEGDIPAGIPVSLLLRRPDVIAAERRLAATGASLKQARAALFPRISLSAGGGTTTKEFSDLLNSDLVVWSLASNLLQPIFQGGRLRATVALMSAQQRLALAQYSQSALTAYTEVENALAAVRYLSRQEEALNIATQEALESRRLAEQRYNTGLTDLITVLEAQRRAYDAESQLLRIRRQKLDARIDLYLALGGGFSASALDIEIPEIPENTDE
ncbi:MAG TPA: efflux transporter outer membrane subunit [Bacteroidetes bacterium]|nr:efflux transporter outer membrane subunit [Bacteroidota bacterium]